MKQPLSPTDLSDPILAVGQPDDAKTLKWLALAAATDANRPTLTALCVRNGLTATTDGFRLHVAPTPATLAELDEALMHASLVPESERGVAWHAWTDSLLEQRGRLLVLEPA